MCIGKYLEVFFQVSGKLPRLPTSLPKRWQASWQVSFGWFWRESALPARFAGLGGYALEGFVAIQAIEVEAPKQSKKK